MTMRNRRGFTLIELIVVLLILSLLAAVVVPVVSERADDADPTRLANDLGNIRSGLELFHLDVRPRYAGDLEDLTLVVQTALATDAAFDTTAFSTSNQGKWDGPYIDATIADQGVILSGYGSEIRDELIGFDPSTNAEVARTAVSDGDFVAVRIDGLDATQFGRLNDLLDGEGEAANSSSGKLRYKETGGTLAACSASAPCVYYLALPYKN